MSNTFCWFFWAAMVWSPCLVEPQLLALSDVPNQLTVRALHNRLDWPEKHEHRWAYRCYNRGNLSCCPTLLWCPANLCVPPMWPIIGVCSENFGHAMCKFWHYKLLCLPCLTCCEGINISSGWPTMVQSASHKLQDPDMISCQHETA